jgi:hypothetical protein
MENPILNVGNQKMLKVFKLQKFLIVPILMVSMVSCSSKGVLSTATNSAFVTRSTPLSTITPTETINPPDQILYAPNGEFIAKFDHAYGHPAFQKQVIEILDKNSLLLWEIPYQGETSMSDPHPSLSIYGWSKDSIYLYFYYRFWPDGGDRAFWWDGFSLQRINVQNGDIEQVVIGEGFVAFAFSPDESEIAFTRELDNPSVIFIRNLSTGTEKTADVIFPAKNYIRVGDIHWSPSGDEIAYQTETKEYMVQTIYLNLVTMKQKVIREYKLFDLWFKGWSPDGEMEFFEKGNVVHVDTQTDETTIIGTSTPTP